MRYTITKKSYQMTNSEIIGIQEIVQHCIHFEEREYKALKYEINKKKGEFTASLQLS